ncbi:MAG: helicase [Rhizobiaceae bacterium]|nr:helicase [Rhizobiaceae bacterium]
MSVSVVPGSTRGLVAVLGPTNTGKTHLAIERMLGHKSGLIGLPLRLLAREVYTKIAERIGTANVSLITGEERIEPPGARYQICTVEAMPQRTDAEFVAIDEVQLATSLERGHVFCDRILNLRGIHETMLLGASTVEGVLRELLPGIEIVSRPRMSMLTYAGSKKITRLPARSAVVAFSAGEVYAIAELIRRQRGGAAVVLGSLSPRTRNAQVALYQSGEVDFLVATDAIGMGLNLDVSHVAFAGEHKFDGFQHRRLSAAEMAQIAGRAGRHTNDGTFGVTGNVEPFEDELVEALETHQFQPQKVLMWRNSQLDFSSLDSLDDALNKLPNSHLLSKALPASDIRALDLLTRDEEIREQCTGEDAQNNVRLLWEICRIPDYRKISPAAHSEILARVFMDVARGGHINEDWFANQTKLTDRIDGDIDALSNRVAHVRTWTYISNRDGWLENHLYWREKTRAIEDKLSDGLHEALTKRFIDRRTSLLMKKLRENAMLEAEISETGDVVVEGHHVGKLLGFRFSADATASGPDAKAASAAAMKALAQEIEKRSSRLAACPNADIVLSDDGYLRWLGEVVARVIANEGNALAPGLMLLADEQLSGASLEKVKNRLERWLANHIENLLRPLVEMSRDETISGTARGVAFQLVENFGHIDRRTIADEVKQLDQDARATLRRHGVRFGAFHIFLPLLLKPAPTSLICLLWAVRHDRLEAPGLTEIPQISATGRTSVEVDAQYDAEIYPLCGFRIMGRKAVRIDILERLADLIRPVLAWKETGEKEGEQNQKPEGAYDGRRFYVTPGMLSILGATHEDMEQVLKGLGYRSNRHLESEIFPVEEAEPKPDCKETTEEKSEAAETTNEPVEELVEGSAANPQTAKVQEPQEPKESGELEEPKTVLLWQRDFKPKRQFNDRGQRGNSKKPGTKGGSKSKQDAKPQAKHQAAKSRKPEKKPDPDSPFAKLAALKDAMGKK